MHTFTITADELTKAARKDPKRDSLSGLCDIVDDLASCLGEDGLLDSDWFNDGEWEARKFDNFDFDRGIAKLDNAAFLKLQAKLGIEIPQNTKAKDGLTLAASIALNDPELWDSIVEKAKAMGRMDLDMEEACSLLPELDKEMEEAAAQYEKEARREYLYGYRNEGGLLELLQKRYSLSCIDIVDYASATVTIEGEQVEEWLDILEQAGKRRDIRLAKKELIASMVYDSKVADQKRKAEAERRREEWAKTKAYQEEQARIMAERKEKERREFLLSMKA